MIVRSGLAISVPILFSSGHPDGVVNWRLYGPTAALITSGTITPASDAISINATISSANNMLAGSSLFSSRDFEWDYTVAGFIVNGSLRYSIEARPPFGVSPDGVRAKLGVELADLPDSDISLIRAYIGFRDTAGAELLAVVSDDAALLSIRDAIEAQAALALIPTMSVRVAVQEDSGTNSYKRQAVDWTAISDALSVLVTAGILAVDPNYDPLATTTALFVLATPSADPITGSTYAV